MTNRLLKPCSLCGANVREDHLLLHRERVHPQVLSSEESKILEALHPKPIVLPSQRKDQTTPLLSQGGPFPRPDVVGERPDDGEGDSTNEDDESTSPSLRDVMKWLESGATGRESDLALSPELEERVENAMDTLDERCGEPLRGEEEETTQSKFEKACLARWQKLADQDPFLVQARERLFEADSPRFKRGYAEGHGERLEALAEPLSVLKSAGERGVPHLAIALMTDSWASPLAADLLAEMPAGPLRNRAMVEALFIRGDFPPEAGERAAPTIPVEERWVLFEKTAQAARDAGTELQSIYWTALFEERPNDDGPVSILIDLGRALHLLYDLGHHSALVSGLSFYFDAFVAGRERVEAVMNDEGVQAFLKTIGERPPKTKPRRSDVDHDSRTTG